MMRNKLENNCIEQVKETINDARITAKRIIRLACSGINMENVENIEHVKNIETPQNYKNLGLIGKKIHRKH